MFAKFLSCSTISFEKTHIISRAFAVASESAGHQHHIFQRPSECVYAGYQEIYDIFSADRISSITVLKTDLNGSLPYVSTAEKIHSRPLKKIIS